MHLGCIIMKSKREPGNRVHRNASFHLKKNCYNEAAANFINIRRYGYDKAGIIGSTGYAGGELARLLLQRDDVEIKWYGSRSYIDQKYASIYQNMFRIVDDACMDDNMKELAEQVDVVFTATPQGLCLPDGRGRII